MKMLHLPSDKSLIVGLFKYSKSCMSIIHCLIDRMIFLAKNMDLFYIRCFYVYQVVEKIM